MSCYHPLKAFPVGKHPSGKVMYKICGFEVDHIDVVGNSFWPSTVPMRSSLAQRSIDEFIEIPCGNCIGCRIAYARAWADRCMLELRDHDSSFFLTLTYDDVYVPQSYYPDPDTGEAFQSLTLRRRDLQLFWKRLRKSLGYQVRYFACGEYGDRTLRPHYHAVVFGLKLNDLKFFSRSKLGYNYYTSDFLSKVWQNGHVIVGEVTWDTCAYTARYVMKKLKGEASEFYELHNLESPFVVMSRKPGIARKYYDEHPELFDSPCVYLSTEQGSHPVYPPRYFKKLFEVDHPDGYELLKARNRILAESKKSNKLSQTDLSYLQYLEVEEASLVSKLKSLPRVEI